MSSQRIGYIRASTLEQSTERQLDGIAVDKIFTDKASGKDINRPQLQAALHHIRTGDTLVVHSMDRLARNVEDMLRLVREMNDRGVSVNFIKENMSFDAGSDDPRSAGNGSLMRLAPIPVFYFDSFEETVHYSALSSQTTHGAREGNLVDRRRRR